MLSLLLIFGFLFLWDAPFTYASPNEEENEGLRRPLLRSGLKESSMHVVADTGKERQLQSGGPCKKWCLKDSKPWTQKCTWVNCAGCNPCKDPPKATSRPSSEPILGPTSSGPTLELWKFVVFADVHSFTPFSYIDNPIDAPNVMTWSEITPIVQNIKTTYGGELIMMPGDMVSYGGRTTEQIKKAYGHPDLTDNQVIYQITKNAARNTRYLFDQNGWNGIPLLACIGDHEIGGNNGFFTSHRSKIPTIPDYRRGFKEGYYFKNESSAFSSNPYWYGNTVVNLSTPSTPMGTPYEGISFAYVHRNALFVTVDAFKKISDRDYLDREIGTGGEGTVTCTVTGAHLIWFESVLSAAQADPSIHHIFVQAHVPIQQPVRKVRCSGQYFDLGVASLFWKVMEKYGVDVYFAGEVHSNTATQASSSGLVQLVTRSNRFYGFLTVDVLKDVIDIKYMREEGDLPRFNNAYVEGGRLTIDKSGTLPTITSSGELEIHDLSKPIIAFDFEQLHNLGDREIVGHRGNDTLIGTSIDIQGYTATKSFHNKGVYGSHYDAPTHKVVLTPSGDATLGMAGLFDGSASQMAVYAFGPYTGGEPMSFSMWFKTERSNAEMVLFNYGSAWNSQSFGTQKDHFMLTLDNGVPAVRIQKDRSIKVSNKSINLADGNWHLIAVLMPSKSCLLSEVKVYIDRERAQTALQGTDLNIFTTTAGRMSLGGVGYFNRAYVKTYPNLDPFTGLLDDFKLWAKSNSVV